MKTGLRIIDDFGLVDLDRNQRLDLMEIVEDGHIKSSTVMASQLPFASLYDAIGEERMDFGNRF